MASTINAVTTGGGGVAITGDSSGNLAIQTNNGNTAMTIDTSQNVGIGTSSPSYKLQVQGTSGTAISATDTTSGSTSYSAFRADSQSSSGLLLQGNASFGVYAGANSLNIINTASAPIAFHNSNGSAITERMRIDSSGNVLVNTTSVLGSGLISASFDQTVRPGLIIKAAGASYNANQSIGFLNASGGSAGYIILSSATATAYVTTSDYRLKENVVPMTGALEKIALLNPVTYTWKETKEEGQGFIAHELQEVFPDAVSGQKDAVDEEGNIKPQGVDTSFLVATLTAAIQELKAELDTVKTELAALKGAA